MSLINIFLLQPNNYLRILHPLVVGLFGVGILLGYPCGYAIETAPKAKSVEVISILEAVNEATENNPQLKALKKTLDLRDYDVDEAGHIPNPTIYGMFGTGNIVSQLGANHSLDVTQKLELGNKRGKRVAVAKAQKQREITLYNQAVHHFQGDVKRQYSHAARAMLEIEMLDEHAALLQDFLKLTQGRPVREAQQVTLVSHQVQLSRLKAQHELDSALIKLNTLLARPSGAIVATVDPSEVRNICHLGLAGPSWASIQNNSNEQEAIWERFAIEHRADYQAALDDLIVQKRQLSLDKRKAIPDVNVGLSYLFVTTLSPMDVSQRDTFRGLFPHASLDLPLFHNNKAEVTRDRHAIEQAQWSRERLEQVVYEDVKLALHSLKAANERILFSQSQLVPLSKTLTQDLIEDYKQERIDALTVVFTIQTEEEMKAEVLRANEAFYDAWLELGQAIGDDPNALLRQNDTSAVEAKPASDE